jgi:hypothetical protein
VTENDFGSMSCWWRIAQKTSSLSTPVVLPNKNLSSSAFCEVPSMSPQLSSVEIRWNANSLIQSFNVTVLSAFDVVSSVPEFASSEGMSDLTLRLSPHSWTVQQLRSIRVLDQDNQLLRSFVIDSNSILVSVEGRGLPRVRLSLSILGLGSPICLFNTVNVPIPIVTNATRVTMNGLDYVSVRGDHFWSSSHLVCKLGLHVTVSAEFVSSVNLLCPITSEISGNVSISVSNNKAFYSNLIWLNLHSMTLSRVFPSFGISNGGTLVSIFGHGFTLFENKVLMFGVVSTEEIILLSDSLLLCRVPIMPMNGVIQISAVIPSMSLAPIGSLSFNILKTPAVLRFYPRFAYPSSNFMISIYGGNFSPFLETKCIFGDHVSNAQYFSESAVACSTPIFSTMQSIPLSLSVASYEVLSVGTVDVVPVPYISIVSPSVVSTQGSILTLIGKHFKDVEGHVCAFGSNFTTVASVMSDDRVECQAPDVSRISNFSVDLLHPYYQRLRGPNVQVSRIRVAGVTPSFGPRTGGTFVTIFGENFDVLVNPVCVFGGVLTVPASPSADNASLVCVTPLVSSATRQSVQIRSASSTADSFALFQFAPSLTISSVRPTFITLGFASMITISGTGFLNTTKFRLSSADPLHLTLVSSKVFVAQFLPFFSESTIDFSYSVDGQSYTYFESLTVRDIPLVYVVTPLSIPAVKSRIDVTGAGFLTGFVYCRIGEILVESMTSSANSLSCMFNSLTPGNNSFSLETVGGVVLQSSLRNIVVLPEFQLLKVEPSFCVAVGGKSVTLHGSGFPSFEDLICSFGGMMSSPSNVTNAQVVCTVPEQRSAKTYISLLGQNSESVRLPFIVSAVPVLHHMSPSIGIFTGGTRVTLTGGPFEQFSNPFCRFRSQKVRAVILKEDTIVCVSPPSGSKSGNEDIDVSISLDGDFFSDTSSMKFVYLRMIFHSAIPAIGSKSGGQFFLYSFLCFLIPNN